MKERPILFSGEMVRAILDGRKTQTRRVMNTRGIPADEYAATLDARKRPAYEIGDRLWVRETILIDDAGNSGFGQAPFAWHVNYLANKTADWCFSKTDLNNIGKKPSIHMPKWAARLWLEVTGVRVERLQDISEGDAQAEGVTPGKVLDSGGNPFRQDIGRLGPLKNGTHRGAFIALWNSINEKRGFGWDANPWVWVVEFRILPTEDSNDARN